MLTTNVYGADSTSIELFPSDSISIVEQKASEDAPYLKWFVGSMFVPGATIVASEVMPVDTLQGYDKKYNDLYRKAFRKERTQASIYGSILGGLMLVWWGLIIL